ncbi:response regulator transcription factor [Saccharibacillus kuerlensis]|uniref:DNA-binding response regulator n=1 Tax=Saccharibacillus kuerlensis TaxID=459527 RepID=A0ABQ2L3C5_9BACL|nr:response regulator [Saccharibacillus kuerlensis]GGO01089.1 DNA-binding response regulator [Saccharibacillus kuerlensis]
MRKILIVDDEKNIRLGLKAMIEREYANRFDICLASDAFEALDLFKSTSIDIMLTDICMPEIDGIELIKSIQNFEHKPVCVIVSGYDDFTYAKEAIRYEVRDYLLKPVIREELAKTIERIEQELVRQEEVKEKLTTSAQQWEEYRESQLHFYSLNAPVEPDEAERKLAQLDLQWMENGFRMMLVKYAGNPERFTSQWFRSQVEMELEAAGFSSDIRNARFFNKLNHLVLVIEGEHDFEGIAEHLLRSNPDLIVSVSGLNFGMVKLYETYSEATTALKYAFMRSTPGIAVYDDFRNRTVPYSIAVDSIRKISNMMGAGREREMLTTLHRVMDANEINRYSIDYLEALSRTFNELVFDHVFQLYGKESVELLKRYKAVGNPYNFNFFHEYVHEVEDLVLLLNNYIKTLKAAQLNNKEMKMALEYIHKNYAKNISMTLVSNIVSFNYSYFSQAFREYTGENFVSYLKRYRLGKAKELLETTQDKIFEVAQSVGFENTKNFNRVFKESEGVSPVEYRNQKKVLAPTLGHAEQSETYPE